MRIRKTNNLLKTEGRLPYLISSLTNIRYLTGFGGSYGYLVIGGRKNYFISDSRYQEYARKILPESVAFVLQEKDIFSTLKKIMGEMESRELYLEEHSLPLSSYNLMKKNLRGIKLIPGGDIVNDVRVVKDDKEIEVLREAAGITDSCFRHLLSIIKPGICEWDIAVEIEYFYRKNGCTKTSFDSIVASGAGSSMPHYVTSMGKKIAKGDPVLIDMGCVYQGYNSDLTRTVFVGTIEDRFMEMYNVVLSAQQKAVQSVKPGITTGKLDSVARTHISEAGYGDYFGHSLGHGVGMEVHEFPAVKPGGDIKLKKNSVITIEPGIYIPDYGGIRIEDMVCVRPGGYEVLTQSSREIIIL
ncbi:MAG TPA: aminopeptidase P family protein [Spirochaetota bacterium]|nr:aminopeptidase P family protein [Spirochaetota bacterium]